MVYFLCFALLTYALCFLAADARIFGADTTAWCALSDDSDAGNAEWAQLRTIGVLRIRPFLLRYRVLQEHLSCYFCMGVWAGPIAHIILWWFCHLHAANKTAYVFWHANSVGGWVFGCTCAFLVGSAVSFVINAAVLFLEARAGE